jgi:hypothetical protein
MKPEDKFDLFDGTTPLVFADGSDFYGTLAKTYRTHKKGLYILAPSGSGTTYFVHAQTDKNWLDGDVLWMSAHAHPEGPWWRKRGSEFLQIMRRSDVLTYEAIKQGFWVVGSSNYDLVPDAIVLPDLETHKRYIHTRETTNYDGGITSGQVEQLRHERDWVAGYAKKGVPQFNSVAEAAEYLASK